MWYNPWGGALSVEISMRNALQSFPNSMSLERGWVCPPPCERIWTPHLKLGGSPRIHAAPRDPEEAEAIPLSLLQPLVASFPRFITAPPTRVGLDEQGKIGCMQGPCT